MNTSKKSIAVTLGMIGVNLTLFFIKLYIGLFTGSICIYTDAINNLTDCLTCIIAVVGFYILSKVKNEKYPFGFGKTEEMVTFITSAVIIVAGCTFAYSSLERLIYPMPVAYTAAYAYLLAGTAFVKLFAAVFLRFFIKKNPSPILANMRIDSLLDFFISLSTVMSFTVSEYFGLALDGVVGMIISILIVVSGVKMLIPCVKSLMGRRDDKLCGEALMILEDYGIEVCDIQCHSYGKEKVFTAKICNDCNISEIADKFKNEYGYDLFVRM